MKRWVEYFRETLDRETAETSIAVLEKPPIYDNLDIEALTITEIRTAIQRLKTNKSVGVDNLPAELFKCGGEKLIDHIHQIITNILSVE